MENLEKIQQLQKKFKAMTKVQKSQTIAMLIFCFIAIVFIFGCVSGWLLLSIAQAGDKVKGGIIYYGFATSGGLILTLGLVLVLVVMIIVLLFRVNRQNQVVSIDHRGIRFLKDATFGSSRIMEKEEAQEIFEVGDIKNINTTIYGQFSDNGEEVCGYKAKTQGASGNQNNLIIGPPGSGKSYTFVRTEILQSIERGESFIVTDPSGELFTSTSKHAKEMKYDVKVLNLSRPDYSDCWNCLNEIVDPETERLNQTRLDEFVSIYMKNSSDNEGKSEEKFWYDCATNLLKAVIGYASYRRENEIVTQLKDLYKKVSAVNSNETTNLNIMRMDKRPFPETRKLILDTAKQNGFNTKEVKAIIDKIFETAPECNIGTVYDILMDFDKNEEYINTVPDWHPAATAFKIFKTNASSDAVRGSALQGAQMRMGIFANEDIRAITSHDGIDLANCNKKKSAYYVIISDKTTNTKPISSLCFSFLFKDAQDEWDKAQTIADEKGEPNPRLPINVILDEFFSIGVIGGSPRSFTTTMSNARKRQIHISIIVQAYPSQVKELYGENNTKTILADCGMLLVLGCNDDETANFVSRYIGSAATVLSEKHKETGGIFNQSGTGIEAGATSRALYTVDEVRTLKNKVICVKQGENPIELNPFPWKQHPAYINGLVQPVSIYSAIKPINETLERKLDSFYEQTDFKTEIHNDISNLISSKYAKKGENPKEDVKEKTEKPKTKDKPKEIKSTKKPSKKIGNYEIKI